MPDYEEIINDLKKAKKNLMAPETSAYIDSALIKLIALQSQQNYEIKQMGDAYKEGYIDKGIEELTKPEGTIRSTIDEIDRLSSGELKSTWKK